MRIAGAVLLLFAFGPATARAETEWQVKPFVGLTFGGSTKLVDPEHAVGKTNGVYGVSGTLLGDLFGVEFDVGRAPGFFESGDGHLVSSSSATTLTANFVAGPSQQATKYTLRPYVLGGFGLMHARTVSSLPELSFAVKRPTVDVGGGVTGFVADRVGLSWELRYFRSLGGEEIFSGTTLGAERLSFFRANMALVVKF